MNDDNQVHLPLSQNAFDEDQLYSNRFASLSVADLLEARDTYHVHLLRKANVVSTAIGLFLIRRDDEDFTDHERIPAAAKKRGGLAARTLENSAVRPWSWPCVLVFVREWKKQASLSRPESVIPPFLYLRDGRVVPVCVVEAKPATVPVQAVSAARRTSKGLHGGSALYSFVQGQRRIGTAGCLVSDGSEFYVLTSRHVAGASGTKLTANPGSIEIPVGVSAAPLDLGSIPFQLAFPAFAGSEAVAHYDAGLVRLDSITGWSPECADLGKLGPLLDFSDTTASLDWIGKKTMAFGAVSGLLKGEIRALFYRYAELGGRELVSDFLIGPRSEPGRISSFIPQHGDSGTLHCLDPGEGGGAPRPFALQWGGQKLIEGTGARYAPFALASSLGVICRELELNIVTDWSADSFPYWGAVGHFKIAQAACHLVKDKALSAFLLDNIPNLSYADDEAIWSHGKPDPSGFVPLSDVPDIVWKWNINKVHPEQTRREENTNHYADMDLQGADGKTLFDLCEQGKALDLRSWMDFYDSAKAPSQAGPAKVSRGCLPFRVWQVYSAMTGFAAKGQTVEFLCAAGVLAHYVGDACQPLHTSQHSDGLDGSKTGVHSTYEDHMVEAHGAELSEGVSKALADGDWPLLPVNGGADAGMLIVDLAKRCHGYLPPEAICESYNRVHPGHSSATASPAVTGALWDDCGQGTILCIADGIRTLASLWESGINRWGEGKAPSGAVRQEELESLYITPSFIASKSLDNLKPEDLG